MKITATYNTRNKFCVARVHYTADPTKATPEWIAKAKEGISEKGWNREYEIGYDVFSGQPVYPEFAEMHISSNLAFIPGSYMLGGWDFGYHHPAFVAAYVNTLDQLCIVGEQLGSNESIQAFASRVLKWRTATYPGAQWIEACDPAGHQKTDKSEFTSVEVLNSLGIYPTSKPSHIREGLEIIQQRMMRRNDGQVGILIHPMCRIIIDSLKGGYRYPEVKDGSPEKEDPLKDGYYEHLMDALRYLCVNNFNAVPVGTQAVESGRNDIMRGGRSGLDVGEYF
jgi:hypothetical protein